MRCLFLEMLKYARKRKPDMVLFANVNRPNHSIGRGCTIISTEDGYEPGYHRFQEGHEIKSDDDLQPIWEDPLVPVETEAFDPEKLRFSHEIFRHYGNMSSPSVMFVLDKILREARPAPGSRGLRLSYGAGFTAFAALVEFL